MAYKALQRRGFLLPSNFKEMKNQYDGAGSGRRAAGWDNYAVDPNTSASGLPLLRNRSRRATRNDGYSFSGVDSLVSNTIGTGITPKPRYGSAELRAEMQMLWEDWTDEADADGVLDFYGLQTLAARTFYTAGEVFIRLRPRREEDGLSVPLQLQVLSPEFVPVEKNETLPNGNKIRNGIEFNTLGQRTAYHMYRAHPHEGYSETTAVPADQVIHIFEPLEAGQIRGTPTLTPVLLKLHSLERFDDAVLFRQQVANLFAGFIRKPISEDDVGPDGMPIQLDSDGETPMLGLEPGSMQELLPGEEVEFSSPPDAGNSYPDFMRQQLQATAAGMGLPYELLTGDYRGVNDRIMRVALNEFRRRIEQRQFNVFVHQMCRVVRNAWLDMAVLSGAIDIPNYRKEQRQYKRTRWVPQGWAYINPVQDVAAKRAEVRAGFTSRSEVVLRNGYDAELIDAEAADDNKRADDLGLVYDTDGRQRDGGGHAQPDFEEDRK